MKEIPLTQGKVALVDDEDYDSLSKYKWFAHKDGNTYYAGRVIRNNDGKYKQIWMHRVLLDAPKGTLVDHIDHNGLNNTRKNIRLCNYSQNVMNSSCVGRSKYKGVSFYSQKKPKPVRASICINGKFVHLGSFYTEIEGARAYDCAAVKYFGEFANLNFPEEWGREKRAS